MSSWGTSLLPQQNATKLDLAQEETDAARYPLDADVIRRTKDALQVDEALLPALAWEFSDDLWNPDWDLQKRRNVANGALALQRLKGTVAGLKAYLEVVDADLIQVVAPPQAFFAGPDLSKADWDAWIGKLPQIRVLVGNSLGTSPQGFFAGSSFADVDFITIDEGPALYGRLAYLRRNGVDTPLKVYTTKTNVEQRVAVDYESVAVPGLSPDGFIAGVSFASQDYAAAELRPAEIVTYALDRSYIHADSKLHLTTLSPGLKPIDTKYQRVSDVGDGGLSFFADADFPGTCFATADDGWKLLADILYLNDPDIAVPFVDSFGFAGVTRVGISPFTAEAMIRAESPALFGDFFAGETVVGEGYAAAEDRDRIDEAQDAAAASLSARDKLLVTFETTRALRLADGIPLDGSITFSSRLPAYL